MLVPDDELFIAVLAASLDSHDQERREHEKELMDEILADIPKSEEEYLDLSLDDEAAVLCEYLARLSSVE